MNIKQSFVPVTALCFLGLLATLFGVGLTRLLSSEPVLAIDAVDASATVPTMVIDVEEYDRLMLTISTLQDEVEYLQAKAGEPTPAVDTYDVVFAPFSYVGMQLDFVRGYEAGYAY